MAAVVSPHHNYDTVKHKGPRGSKPYSQILNIPGAFENNCQE